jgi:hypothetical protein
MLTERSSSSFMSSSVAISLCSFATSSSLTGIVLVRVCQFRCQTYRLRSLVSLQRHEKRL